MIEKAKALLVGETRCAILKGDKTFLSEKRGIAPLMELYDSGEDYSGCVAADRLVGKAAAFIYVMLGAKEIYARVLSKAAVVVLNEHGIKYSYDIMADFIHNRQGDGICPMEKTVAEINDPSAAIAALKNTLAALRKGM